MKQLLLFLLLISATFPVVHEASDTGALRTTSKEEETIDLYTGVTQLLGNNLLGTMAFVVPGFFLGWRTASLFGWNDAISIGGGMIGGLCLAIIFAAWIVRNYPKSAWDMQFFLVEGWLSIPNMVSILFVMIAENNNKDKKQYFIIGLLMGLACCAILQLFLHNGPSNNEKSSLDKQSKEE